MVTMVTMVAIVTIVVMVTMVTMVDIVAMVAMVTDLIPSVFSRQALLSLDQPLYISDIPKLHPELYGS